MVNNFIYRPPRLAGFVRDGQSRIDLTRSPLEHGSEASMVELFPETSSLSPTPRVARPFSLRSTGSAATPISSASASQTTLPVPINLPVASPTASRPHTGGSTVAAAAATGADSGDGEGAAGNTFTSGLAFRALDTLSSLGEFLYSAFRASGPGSN
jgi:hypothetical protein